MSEELPGTVARVMRRYSAMARYARASVRPWGSTYYVTFHTEARGVVVEFLARMTLDAPEAYWIEAYVYDEGGEEWAETTDRAGLARWMRWFAEGLATCDVPFRGEEGPRLDGGRVTPPAR